MLLRNRFILMVVVLNWIREMASEQQDSSGVYDYTEGLSCSFVHIHFKSELTDYLNNVTVDMESHFNVSELSWYKLLDHLLLLLSLLGCTARSQGAAVTLVSSSRWGYAEFHLKTQIRITLSSTGTQRRMRRAPVGPPGTSGTSHCPWVWKKLWGTKTMC